MEASLRSMSATTAQLSATTHFLKNPHSIWRQPSTAFSYENSLGRRNCGRRFDARSIGPATSCGKKAMNAKKAIGSRVGRTSRLYTSIVYESAWNV